VHWKSLAPGRVIGYKAGDPRENVMQLISILTCPACGHRQAETMPTDACRYFYECKSCRQRLRPKQGDCCVFCSYGDVPCPPVQAVKPGASS
jgi:hypothetical protein